MWVKGYLQQDEAQVGDEVEAKIVDMDVEKERMNLSIKALTPAPEGATSRRRERNDEGDAEGEKPRRERRRDARPAQDDDEPREWNEGGVSGVSLGDLINK